ncbi:MAG: tetratricopeptide repeat protein, partial [Methylococcales bacterium]
QTLWSLNNLAHCLKSMGRPGEALPLYEQDLKACRRVLGEEHPDTLTSRNNMATCLDSLGRPDKALPLFRQVVEARQRVLGETHPESLSSLNNLALCLKSLGRSRDARKAWNSLVELLCRQPQISSTWIKTLNNTSNALCDMIQQDDYPDWPVTFHNLAQALNKVLDLQDPRQLAAMRPTVSRFYENYLSLCLHRCPDQVPEAFAGMQGRKLAALILEEIDHANVSSESLLGQYLAVRLKLRQLALGLQVLSRDGPQADGLSSQVKTPQNKEKPIEIDSYALTPEGNGWAEYLEADKQYDKLHAALLDENPQFGLAAKVLQPTLGELQGKLDPDTALVFLFRFEAGDVLFYVAFIIQSDSTRDELLWLLNKACAINLKYTKQWEQASGHPSRFDEKIFNKPESVSSETEMQQSLSAAKDANYEPVETVLDLLTTALNEGLWQPLQAVLPNVRRIHLVTHAELHLLPYELACPKQWTVSTYPGFVYYYLLN